MSHGAASQNLKDTVVEATPVEMVEATPAGDDKQSSSFENANPSSTDSTSRWPH
jgi:hypothetical protein